MIQEDWKPFRPPAMYRMGKNGDNERFLCIMEINEGEILGASVVVPDRLLNDSYAWAKAMSEAWDHIAQRAKLKMWYPPGSSFESFIPPEVVT